MKKIFFGVWLIAIMLSAAAQPNNPYNQRGRDYVTSFDMIQKDFYAGKAGDFSEATLQYYSKTIPLQNKASVEVAAEILKLRTAGTLDFNQFLQNSSLSAVSGKIFMDVLFNPGGLSDADFRETVKSKVDQIAKTAMPTEEKELVLSLLAIAYHFTEPSATALRNSERRGCWISGPYGQGLGTPAQCAAASAIVGGVIGWSICGILCGFGGAIIGGIAGALS